MVTSRRWELVMALLVEMAKVEREGGGGGSGMFSYNGTLDLNNFFLFVYRMDYSNVIILHTIPWSHPNANRNGRQHFLNNQCWMLNYPLASSKTRMGPQI